MSARKQLRRALRLGVAGAVVAAGTYTGWAAASWRRYGHPAAPAAADRDELLDRFMPIYDVVERHRIGVRAPADVTFSAAKEQDLLGVPAIRAIFKTRALVVGGAADQRPQPRALLAQMQSLGWGVLAERPSREVVVGAVTRPWEANVTFRALEPGQFAGFNEPGYVKIAWTLRAEAVGPAESLFRTETRAIATDRTARTKFRRYWSFLSPGIILIRWTMLGPLKREAERRYQQSYASSHPQPEVL